MQIIAKCQYGEDRAKQFFRFHMLIKSQVKFIYWMISLGALAVGVILILKNEGYYGLFSIFIALMTMVVWFASAHTALNKVMKDLRFPALNYQLVFSESGLEHHQSEVVRTYLWTDLKTVCETKSMIYFYVSKSAALILGKYLLKDEERTQLETWISQAPVRHRKYLTK